jgi:hypothetical protein
MACGRIAGVISPFVVGLIIGAQNISLMRWLMGAVEMIAASYRCGWPSKPVA